MNIIWRLAAYAAAFLVSASANAAEVNINFAGTISSSRSNTHVGESFTGYYTFDTDDASYKTVGNYDYFANIFYEFQTPFGRVSGNTELIRYHSEYVTSYNWRGFNLSKFSLRFTMPPSELGSPIPPTLSGHSEIMGFQNGGYGITSDDIRIVSQAAAPVPEPATWVMIILGFGLVGGTLRHRHRKATPIHA